MILIQFIRFIAFQSTHLLRGATKAHDPKIEIYYFNPRTSCEVRLSAGMTGTSAADFNPRTSCEVRPLFNSGLENANLFQSTHLLRGATVTVYVFGTFAAISIHAPLARCDITFQPFGPASIISIHAPLARCDIESSGKCGYNCRNFNPRTSCEVRHGH